MLIPLEQPLNRYEKAGEHLLRNFERQNRISLLVLGSWDLIMEEKEALAKGLENRRAISVVKIGKAAHQIMVRGAIICSLWIGLMLNWKRNQTWNSIGGLFLNGVYSSVFL